MDKRYELIASGEDDGLYRIRALRPFPCLGGFVNIKAGDLGGLVDSEDILSQEGTSWLDERSIATRSRVEGDCLLENAHVYDSTLGGRYRISSCTISDSTLCGRGNLHATDIEHGCRLAGEVRANESSLLGTSVEGGAVLDRSGLGKGSAVEAGASVRLDCYSLLMDCRVEAGADLRGSALTVDGGAALCGSLALDRMWLRGGRIDSSTPIVPFRIRRGGLWHDAAYNGATGMFTVLENRGWAFHHRKSEEAMEGFPKDGAAMAAFVEECDDGPWKGAVLALLASLREKS